VCVCVGVGGWVGVCVCGCVGGWVGGCVCVYTYRDLYINSTSFVSNDKTLVETKLSLLLVFS